MRGVVVDEADLVFAVLVRLDDQVGDDVPRSAGAG